MGLVSVMFWIASLVSTAVWSTRTKFADAEKYLYLVWTTVKIVHFPFVQIIQIFIFQKVRVGYAKKKAFLEMKAPYFLIPFLMLTSFALVVNFIICEYRYYVEKFIEKANYSTVTQILFATGSPMGIAFSVHIFLHFLTMFCYQMKNSIHNDYTPLLDNR